MWLDRLFADGEIDFERRCKNRIRIGAVIVLLGAVSVGLMAVMGERAPVIDQGAMYSGGFISSYYTSMGIALMAAGAVKIANNVRWLKHPELMKKRAVEERDERNRLLGLRCWAYTGYAMFLVLYLGILASGFVSVTVMVVLQVVTAVYAVMLLGFRVLLSRMM